MTDHTISRAFLKADRWDEWAATETDQRLGLPAPPFEKPVPPDAVIVDLVPPEALTVGTMPLIQAMGRRRSRRHWTAESLSLEELSFLLWATQGVDVEATEARLAHMRQAYPGSPGRAQFIMRTVPSGGSRHPFETYLIIQRVGDLAQASTVTSPSSTSCYSWNRWRPLPLPARQPWRNGSPSRPSSSSGPLSPAAPSGATAS